VVEGKEMILTLKESGEVLFKIKFKGCVNRPILIENLLRLHGYTII